MGISVKGAIVIARYFGSWRGIKPKVAAEHGAVGCLIYSDPRDDGYTQGDVYPQGPWRPREGAQRGSVMEMEVYPGDPLTPGVGATKDAKRLPIAQAPTLTKIPVLPISYSDAQPLLGSTEWVEANADELSHKAVAYLNTDSNGRGYLGMAGSHSLQRFINDVARDIDDPETRLTVWKRAQLRAVADAATADRRNEIRGEHDLRIGALGSGSDYSPFLQHLGIASLNLEYGGEDGGGIYHSIYDDFAWYTRFSDTSFVYGRALAQTVGTAVMRLADAEVVPYEFTSFGATVGRYGKEVEKLLQDAQAETAERNRELDDGVFSATADPQERAVPPARQDPPPHLDFAPLQNAIDAVTRAADRYEQAFTRAQATGTAFAQPQAAALNATLIRTERALQLGEGLPRRPWFHHAIYAPGFYTGYGVKTLPGVREAIEQRNWKEADAQITLAAGALSAEAEVLDRAAAQLEQLAP